MQIWQEENFGGWITQNKDTLERGAEEEFSWAPFKTTEEF